MHMIRSFLMVLLLVSTRCVAAGVDSVETRSDDSARRYVPASEFTYGGAQRATLYGRLPLAVTDVDPLRASIVGAIMGGALVKLHIDMTGAWWPDSGSSTFRFKDDWSYVLQIDKAGHAFAGYSMAYVMSEALMATGVSWDASTVWGSQLALLYQTYIEIEDGFAEGWGFSLTDMASNLIGAELYLAQHFVPALQNVTPKYQFVPAAWIDVPRVSTTWIDDYNSSTFWLSFNVHNLLAPHGVAWPSWLGVALGYGIRADAASMSRRYIIALDYDLVQLLPDGPPAWNWLRQTLNYVKLPAPALEIGDGVRVRVLFPFTIRVGELGF
jgi:hypothetical protein